MTRVNTPTGKGEIEIGTMSNGVYYQRHRKDERAKAQNRASGDKTGRRYRQEDVAEHVGIARSRFSMIENGWTLPTAAELERIAEFLEITPGHLYSTTVLTVIAELDEERVDHQKRKELRP